MAIGEKNKPIETVMCGKCYLRTPAWRSRCIHCERPLENSPLRAPLREASVPVSSRRRATA